MNKKQFSFKRAATIQVPDEFFNPLVTGMKSVDEAWSEIGGIVPSQVTFITGNPGAGKTTLTLAIGACLSNKTPVAFISLEMSDFQLANQAKKIPGFGGVDVSGDFDQEMTMEALRELKPGLVILDSIQKAARKMKDENGKPLPFDRAQFEIVNMFTAFAKETWTPVFLIGHCDKSGNYKGPSDLLHDVDSHLMVTYDKEMDLRTFCFGKNRFGGVMDEGLFGITRDTVWIGSPYITTAFGNAVITPTGKMEVSETQDPTETIDNPLRAAMQNLKTKWDGSSARSLITLTVEKLKREDPDIATRSYIKNSQRVKLAFRGKGVACCFSKSGEIVFGRKAFTQMKVGGIGYAKEQKYIIKHCKDDADLLLWVIIHEWCHLYEGNQHHKNAFFDDVEKKYLWFTSRI
jgi:hypothetical protein